MTRRLTNVWPQELLVEVTNRLAAAGLVTTILDRLASLDWTEDLAGLQKHAALGDPQHVHTVQAAVATMIAVKHQQNVPK